MKRVVKSLICLTTLLLVALSASAAKTELYALDGRSIFVDENQIEAYTAPGMGWYEEKPVTMYAADGRTLVVAADQVEAYKAVGWYLDGELSSDVEETTPEAPVNTTQPVEVKKENNANAKQTVRLKYTDGTVITAPAEHLKMYIALDWTLVSTDDVVTSPEIDTPPVDIPDENTVTVYYHDGNTKLIPQAEYEAYKAQGWYSAFDEAVYAYAAFGNGDDLGATKLLENKQYELAFTKVKDAIDKIENSESEYVSMLYYLRSMIVDAWREAANSPLGFINYWFTDKDNNKYVIFEYRNVSNSRIKYFEINFDICDKNGGIIETNSGSYYVDNLQLVPCDNTRVGWKVESGSDAASIKNVKVKEVRFTDETVWRAAN